MPAEPMRGIHRITVSIALLFSAGVTSGKAQSASPGLVPRPNYEGDIGIGIEQVGVLVYPTELLADGVVSGEVRISISVDKDGVLRDSLVTAYTEQAFADVALAAVKRWRYQPAKVAGNPTASRSDLVFEFRSTGVVVQTTSGGQLRRIYFSSL